jgi:glutathione S-transferase
MYEGPFMFGGDVTISDVIMAPWFERMAVLEHYRDFKVPETEEFSGWSTWCNRVIQHPAIKPT